ncbi:MAG: EAL domain-containing protein [Clostridia bacterium]|nr:EAL domain-containing protein [Clostridia bacterium]
MSRSLDDYIIANIQNAMDAHYIKAYYQPVIRTMSRQLCSFEALARWIDPEIGMIYPDEFIPVLERISAIHWLDLFILRQACARIRSSITNRDIPVPVSVNLSRLDFRLCDIFTEVDNIVSEFHLPHDYIYFEITESVMAEEKDMMLDVVNQFRSAGYQIWMDDFGSAYSSLNILKEFSFDELKLDMCFLRPFNQRSQRIAASVIEMAKNIDIHTLSEGVENEEQFRYLRNIGCEKVQGYYFGRPMPYDEVMAHLREEGIGIELPHDRKYYDDIGRINLLSSVPFMSRPERDAIRTARQLNSIPLALVEMKKNAFSVLFYNSAFEATVQGTGTFANVFSQDILREPIPYSFLSDKMRNLLDSTRSGEEGRMYFTSHDDYYEIQAKCIARTQDMYSVLIRMSNLSKSANATSISHLEESLREICTLFERITLIDVQTDSIMPLYVTTRENLVSGDKGIRKLALEYADKYIYPEDREAYLAFADLGDAIRQIDQGRAYTKCILRTSIRHGQYAWKAYIGLRVDDGRYLVLIANVHEALMDFSKARDRNQASGFSDERMWQNLIQSDLLRIFWKDRERRFLGASRAFLNYYGFTSVDDIVGKSDEDLNWHIHPDQFMNDEMLVIHEGATTHNIPGFCLSEGENKEILASKTPLYDENGEIAGLMGYFIDRKLLTVNDRRGTETNRRDMLTGLLNSRGISEEASVFRDEFYLRGVDFARFHLAIDDFYAFNEQYGFDFGDRVMTELGRALKKAFGRTCAVGRYAGQKFVVLHQVQSREDAFALRDEIKAAARSVQSVEGIPVTLYLSVGFVLFSEFLDLDEQAKKAEVRQLADHDSEQTSETMISRGAEIFHLFDELPVAYSVFHLDMTDNGGREAVVVYVNRKYEEITGQSARVLVGSRISDLYPSLDGSWYENITRAAMDAETVSGEICIGADGVPVRYTANQIVYPGYCAVTYQEIHSMRRVPKG